MRSGLLRRSVLLHSLLPGLESSRHQATRSIVVPFVRVPTTSFAPMSPSPMSARPNPSSHSFESKGRVDHG